MKKQNLLLALSIVAIILLYFSCDLESKHAKFKIYNKSTSVVKNIFTSGSYIEILEADKDCTLITDWVASKYVYASIEFYKDGEKYGCLEKEQAAADTTGRFKPYKRIKNGDTIVVNIYDDSW